MSFAFDKNKPRLVETKLIKFINDKYKQKELEIREIEEIKEMEMIKSNEKWYSVYLSSIKEFFKVNYGFIIIIGLIIILLYVRYLEVTKRKEKIKEIYNKEL